MRNLIRVATLAFLGVTTLFIGYKLALRSPFGAGSALFLAILVLGALFCLLSLRLYARGRVALATNVWLALLFATGTYLVTDVALGFYLIERSVQIPDPIVHHRPRPNRSSVSVSVLPEFRYTRRTNNMGLRGADVSPAKHHSMYRIVMLGDSFTGGRGVDDDRTFSAILERSLNANVAAGADRAVQVLNAGVDSYSPILSYLQLSRQLPPLDPDLVVLNFDMSDLVQESLYRARATYTAAGEPLGVDGRVTFEGPLTTRVRRFIRRHFFFTRRIVIGLERPITGPDTLDYWISRPDRALLQHTLASDTVDRTHQWEGVFDSVLRIKAHCDEIGSDFLLTVYPWGHQVSEDEWATGRDSFLPKDFTLSENSVRTLKEFSVEHGIEFLNTFPAFRAYRGVQRLYYDLDMHWTAAGHRLMARELERRIRSRFLGGLDASEPD